MRTVTQFIRQSLSWKLSLGIILMPIPVFVVALGILLVESRNYIKKEATEHASSVLNTTMHRVSRFMNTIETATDINDWEIAENLNPDSLLAYSRFVVQLNGNIDGCSISTEPNTFPKIGRYFSAYTVREEDTITTIIEQEYEYFGKIWYKTPKLLDKPCWVVYFDDVDSLALTLDGMIASYGKPLYNKSHQMIGVISTDLSLLHLSRVISSEKPYPDSYFMMTDEEGQFMIHPDTTKLFTSTIFSHADPHKQPDIFALGHEMTTGKQGSMSVVMNGEPCLVNYRPVPGTNWSLALVCPERSILKSYYRLSYIIGPLTLIGLILILLFSSISVSQAVTPLNKLADQIQMIAAGHFDEKIPQSSRHDAVGKIQNSFAIMQESLSHHINGIQQINQEMERRNEELVRTTELAKEADRQKSLFIQNVSHQFRTPLNIIMGFSSVLRESKSGLPEEEAKGIINMMTHNAMTLDRMASMLFDSSARGATEEMYADRDEEVSCNEIGSQCLKYTLKHYPDLPLYFGTDLPDDFCIHTSSHYLKLSIRELMYNASRYSDGRYVALRVTEFKNWVRFIVEDTGPGIPEEDAPRLLESFTKVNELSEGLGLGLPLTKRHVTNLGGELILDTTYKAGCRFIIQLPKVKS